MFEGATTLATIHRRLGARICGLAILHSWNRALMHHPRDQCVVLEGRLSEVPMDRTGISSGLQ